MPIRAVLWDVDDTLFDYTGCDRAAALEHLAAEGLLTNYRSSEEALLHWQDVMSEQYARFVAGDLSYAAHRRERARQVVPHPLSDAEADRWFNRYVERYEAAWTLFPDVVPVLDEVARSWRQGVLSNSYAANQDRKLRRLGIRDRFEVLVCSAELGCAKPDPAAFEAACLALSLEPDEVVYVGDLLDIDAGAAAAAGLSGVWLDRSTSAAAGTADHPGSRVHDIQAHDVFDAGAQPGTVVRIGKLDELPPLLRELSGQNDSAPIAPSSPSVTTAPMFPGVTRRQ